MATIEEFTYKLKDDFPPELLTNFDNLSDNEETPDLELIFDALDEKLKDIVCSIFEFINLINPQLVPQNFINYLLLSKGINLSKDFPDINLTTSQLRKLILLAVDIYRQKGTNPGIINIARLLLNIQITQIISSNIDTWRLGENELGEDTYLLDSPGGRGIYSFCVVVLEELTEQEEINLKTVINFMKPSYTHFECILNPGDPDVIDHWELGLSCLGDNTYLHGVPETGDFSLLFTFDEGEPQTYTNDLGSAQSDGNFEGNVEWQP